LEVFIEDREHEFLLGLEDEVLVGGARNVILLEDIVEAVYHGLA
jgi:hypothetical protein